jgi:carboxylate-amine ligase
VWKDVRIHPEYGTIETRIADSMPSLIETVAVATLVQALVIKIGREWDEGTLSEPDPNWLIERNRWAAIKEGLNAKFITGLDGKTVPVIDVIKNLVSELSDIGKELGSINRLNYINNILESTPFVETMRNIHYESSLVSLVKELQKKLFNSLSEGN